MVSVSLGAVAGLLLLSLAAIAHCGTTAGRFAAYGGSLLLSLVLIGAAAVSLFVGRQSSIVLPIGLPWLGAHFRIDALSAFFLVVINVGAAAASLFAVGYGKHEESPERVLPFYPAYIAAMNLVLLSADAFSFLVSWEFMSLSSWALVVAHHRVRDNVRAGYVYLLMASFGTLALLFAFGLMAGAGGNYVFDAMRAMPPTAEFATLILILALVGAGSKAGLVPLHAWLPLAHPAAPSHVSALMSGVMTKVAIYGFIRIVFDLVGAPAWWWSMPVIVVGAITAAMGVLYALMQRDLKRALAYSTVENIGVVFVALGLALAFKANAMIFAAALAMTAALLHILNHSLFKSLLFCGAGAVLTSTGERNLEKLGGLIHRMPRTAFVFLIGCVAISALPPLNGFASEWLTFQAILVSPQLSSWGLKLMIPAAGALLALSAALAGACFVRVYGVAFLGRPRSDAARCANETERTSIIAMGLLAAACLAIGVLPGFVIDALAPVTQLVTGAHMPTQAGIEWLSIVPIAESRSSYNGLLVFLFMAASGMIGAFAIHRLASDKIRRCAIWDCGYPDPSVGTQYSADSFAQPIRRVFGALVFRAREVGEMPPPNSTLSARFAAIVVDPIWAAFYAPVEGFLAFATEKLNVLQFLTIRRYLSLVFAALVLLLLVLAAWP